MFKGSPPDEKSIWGTAFFLRSSEIQDCLNWSQQHTKASWLRQQ